jgi:hypothetical protein
MICKSVALRWVNDKDGWRPAFRAGRSQLFGGHVRRRLVIWAAVVGLVAAAGLVGPAAPALATPSHCFEATCDNVALNATLSQVASKQCD